MLIITYYWPPSGGAGVQRWLKFVKYLPELGWQPIVYTVENGEYPVYDPSLAAEIPLGVEVIRREIWEPYDLFRLLSGRKKEERVNSNTALVQGKKSVSLRLATWIRKNLFIPDPRIFWVRPSVNFLVKYLEKNPVDVVITSSPPHSLQLIGAGLKKKMKIKWIADFRDPWSNYYFLHELNISERVMRKHAKLERKVLENADKVVVVAPSMKKTYELICPGKITLITNGFDTDDFTNEIAASVDGKFSIVFTGTFMPNQNPQILWVLLSELIREIPSFKNDLEIRLVGTIDESIIDDIHQNGLTDYLKLTSYVPHADITRIQQMATILLLCINRAPAANEIVTGKLFEYLGAQRPILCFGPVNGDAAQLIRAANAGVIVDHADKVSLKRNLLDFYEQFHHGGPKMIPGDSASNYTRKNLTGELVVMMNSLTAG